MTSEPTGFDDDLRKFTQLTPMEQLERLEVDGRRVREREWAMREAERQLNAESNNGT